MVEVSFKERVRLEMIKEAKRYYYIVNAEKDNYLLISLKKDRTRNQ